MSQLGARCARHPDKPRYGCPTCRATVAFCPHRRLATACKHCLCCHRVLRTACPECGFGQRCETCMLYRHRDGHFCTYCRPPPRGPFTLEALRTHLHGAGLPAPSSAADEDGFIAFATRGVAPGNAEEGVVVYLKLDTWAHFQRSPIRELEDQGALPWPAHVVRFNPDGGIPGEPRVALKQRLVILCARLREAIDTAGAKKGLTVEYLFFPHIYDDGAAKQILATVSHVQRFAFATPAAYTAWAAWAGQRWLEDDVRRARAIRVSRGQQP